MFWIIFVIILIIVLLLLWWIDRMYTEKNTPTSPDTSNVTIHSRCKENSACGGDLTCDNNCHRCKKRLNGDCASDVDCETGLVCHQWKCVPSNPNIPPIEIVDKPSQKEKHVHWNDAKNEIFPI